MLMTSILLIFLIHYWLIPISSQVNKYQQIYQNKVKKYGYCDTIVFGEVLGYKKAFLIQNMCPITEKYIKNKYVDKDGAPIKISGDLERTVIKNAKSVLAKHRKGKKLIFPDVLKIEAQLTESQ